MNISLVGCPLITIPFQHHLTLKQPLLHCLEQLPQTSVITGAKITKSDWNDNEHIGETHNPFAQQEPKPYWNILYPEIKHTIDQAMKAVDITDFYCSNPWYQQYTTKDFHAWHRHPFAVYNVVYYLELPPNCPPTILRNPTDTKQIITPNVKEGDILIFPSCLVHGSPINETKLRKSIIAFNLA